MPKKGGKALPLMANCGDVAVAMIVVMRVKRRAKESVVAAPGVVPDWAVYALTGKSTVMPGVIVLMLVDPPKLLPGRAGLPRPLSMIAKGCTLPASVTII